MCATRKCTFCGNIFPATTEFFYRSSIGGLRQRCKACYNAKNNSQRDSLGGYLMRLCVGIKSRSGDELRSADLERIYHNQHGLCALSGLPMTYGSGLGRQRSNISVDRIDSNLPYVLENVWLVRLDCNIAKQKMAVSEFRELCAAIVNYGNR